MTKSKPNIVQVSAYYPPHLGGLERVVEEISLQLAKDNYTVIVVTSNVDAKGFHHTERRPSMLIRRLAAFEFAHTPIMAGLFWQLLKTKKPAIFHLHLAQVFVPEIVWFTSKLRGIPYVVHFHLDVEPSGPLGFIFLWWKRFVLPIIIKSAAHIITLSPDQTRLIIERYGVLAEKVTFIDNGVGEQFLEVGKTERKCHDPLRLLFVGRMSLQKRPERLIEAMSLLKNKVELVIVGDGEDKAKHEALAAKLGLNSVQFRGALFGEALLEAYREADVFVLPSDREGMPLVLLEAMATGLPIVGSDVLGITELIKGVGILVSNPSPETFAKAIDELATNPGKLKALSSASYAKAKQYSWESLVARLEGEVYDTIQS